MAGLVAAVALSWALARRLPEHRPIAFLLSALLTVDAASLVLDAVLLAPMRTEQPPTTATPGGLTAGGLVADAVWLAGPAAIVAASLVVFGGRRPWPALVGWAAFVVALLFRDSQRVLPAAQVAMVAVAGTMLVTWYLRKKKAVGSAHYALAMLVAIEATSLFAAWRVGPFEHWDLTQGLYLALLGGLVLLHGRFLWMPQPSS
jgi:hypothetical protein